MKRMLTLLLAVLLVLNCTVVAFADPVASDSNWDYDDDIFDDDWDWDNPVDFAPLFIMPMAAGEDVSNTVDLSKIQVTLRYYNMSSISKAKTVSCNSTGDFVISRPDDYAKFDSLEFKLLKGALPSSGKYDFSFSFSSHTGGFTYKSLRYWTSKYNTNASTQNSNYPVDFSQFSGDLKTSFSVDLGSVSYMSMVADISNFGFPYGGWVKASFTKLSSSATTDYGSAGGSYTSDDAVADTANNTAQIAQGMSDANDTLKEIIQTISNQLEAFWHQLYNIIHLQQLANDNRNTDRIIDSQQNTTNQIIESNEENTTNIIENNNDNTNTIVNGYDSSKLDDSSNKLNDTLTQYDDLENSISESMGSYFDNFEYANISGYPSGVLSSLLFFGNYIQKIFESIGHFNLPITLGLTVTFVLMLVGYFRYGR